MKMIKIPEQKVSIAHLLPEANMGEYLRQFSELLFALEDNAQHVDAATLNSMTKKAATNIIADVYKEMCNTSNANRTWKIRGKRTYSNRQSYSREAFVLKWLQERHAPVPSLIAFLVDITKKDELRKELSPYVDPEKLEAVIERGAEKEGLVMRTLKEPRHDQDLAYFVGKIHKRSGIDKKERETYRKLLRKASAMALESIVTVNVIGNHYYEDDFKEAGIELADPFRDDPCHYENEITKNLSRIIIANLIEQKAMRDNKDEIDSYRLPAELKETIQNVFAPVLRYLADERFRGFVHGETQPLHLAIHESPDREGQIWQGYHLFDFDKSRVDNIVLDTVRYLNNPIASLPHKVRRKLFLGSIIHVAKTLSDIREQDPEFNGYSLPVEISQNRKRREELQEFAITNTQKILTFQPHIKGTPIDEWMKTKDYLSLFAYIELAGRASKTGYGAERHKYADLHGKVEFYYNSFFMGNSKPEPVEFGKFYDQDRTRKYCAKEMHELLNRMITNQNKNLGYKLSDLEVEELRALKGVLEKLSVEYPDKTVPIKYFNLNAK